MLHQINYAPIYTTENFSIISQKGIELGMMQMNILHLLVLNIRWLIVLFGPCNQSLGRTAICSAAGSK
jgi:hypothetical protein